MIAKTRQTLTPDDWIKAAFCMLAARGVSSVKAEILALELGATKGSFYWHFKDVPTLHVAMLTLWRDKATAAIINDIMAIPEDGQARLFTLTRIIASLNTQNDYGGAKAEPAIREWARFNDAAAEAVRHVDAARIAFVQNLFASIGFDDARERAELYYAGYVGLQALATTNAIEIGPRMESLVVLLLQMTEPHLRT